MNPVLNFEDLEQTGQPEQESSKIKQKNEETSRGGERQNLCEKMKQQTLNFTKVRWIVLLDQ